MCGIAGIIASSKDLLEESVLRRMTSRMVHRGPDDAGVELTGRVGFGFRRLAILDLSAAGHQPMWDPAHDVMIVFNGEIYNFQELRAELQQEGLKFETGTDTEVLLKLYKAHGIEALSRLNGMFAFAIYDSRNETVVLVRDRLGVKPLYCWKKDNTFAFASEVAALRELPTFPHRLSQSAVGSYLRLGVVPHWTSVYEGVMKLPPGTWLRVHLRENRVEGPVKYWDLPDVGEEEGVAEETWIDRIDELLQDATRLRLRSDVPLGVFLSGGIDSGLVASTAARVQGHLSAFTMGFDEESADETEMANISAEHLKLKLLVSRLSLTEAMDHLPRVMGHFDEPFADSSALPTSMVCAEARKQFTVMLSGDGGDEVFAGYRPYLRAWQWRHADLVPAALRRAAAAGITLVSAPDSRWRRFAHKLPHLVGRFGLGGSIYASEDWLQGALKPEFYVGGEQLIQSYNSRLREWPRATSVDLAQRTDIRQYLLEDILDKVDRMSMRHSIELRSPFLDYRMVELGLRIPTALRVKNGRTKYLLRRLSERYLPAQVCAGQKRGFSIPIDEWMFGSSAAEAFRRTLIQPNKHFEDPFLPGACERLWNQALRNPALTHAVFKVLSFRWWCQQQAAG
jgi:asparagine synthase (glutamine-hydrolysing)